MMCLGNVLTATDANGVTITNTYDRAGRVKTRTYSGEPAEQTTPPVDFYYDGKGLAQTQNPNYAKGKLTKVTSSVSETRYSLFDNFGRLKESSQITDGQTYTSKYTYNLSGALIEEEYPSGRVVKNEFESDGDLLTVTSKKAGSSVYTPYVSNFSYTASGGISQMKLGNGRWETAKFNTRLQVTELGLGSGPADASSWKVNYEYGELNADGTVNTTKNTGNIARQTLSFNGLAHPFVQAYKYDSLYRLTEAKETANSQQNWIQNWTYDRYGNRLSFSQNIGGIANNSTPTVDANTNRFVLNQGFSYDKNGNVVTDIAPENQPRTFIFNGDNKQTEVKKDGVTVGRYFYDGEGKRVKKVTDTETTVFVYSAGKLVAEYSTQLSTQPSTNYTTTDHLGSPRIITDELGQVKSRRDFMPFGEELFVNIGARTTNLKYGTDADNVRQKFTGYLKDSETSLDFAEARMYENRYARFTAVDPLLASGKSANPQTFNRYIYVGNNPLLRVDPTGEDWYKATRTILTYGGRHIKVHTPVWHDRTVFGKEKWTHGVFQVGRGADRGKWNALDPYSNNFKQFDTKAEAIAAYRGFQSQRNADAIGGAVRAFADTADSVSPLGYFQVNRRLAGAAMSAVGINPNESSDVFRVSNTGTHGIIALATAFGGETLSARVATNVVRTEAAIAAEARFPTSVSTLEPGPFATRSIPARGNAPLTTVERAEIDIIGRTSGCHTCGTTNPGTSNGRFIGDHQGPSALGLPTEIYPHCLRCSTSQGGIVRGVRDGRFPNPYHDR